MPVSHFASDQMETLAPADAQNSQADIEIPTSERSGDIGDLMRRLSEATFDTMPLGEALSVTEEIASTVNSSLKATELNILDDLHKLSVHIQRTRTEIAALQPNAIKTERLPEAGEELEAIVEQTEFAAGAIMHAAEAIMEADASDPEAYQDLVNEQVLNIIQACAFQDLTGQRVSKVISSLNYIDERISRLIDAARIADADFATEAERKQQQRAEKNFLHGPQLPEEALAQDAVDDLFSQDDIDALFD